MLRWLVWLEKEREKAVCGEHLTRFCFEEGIGWIHCIVHCSCGILLSLDDTPLYFFLSQHHQTLLNTFIHSFPHPKLQTCFLLYFFLPCSLGFFTSSLPLKCSLPSSLSSSSFFFLCSLFLICHSLSDSLASSTAHAYPCQLQWYASWLPFYFTYLWWFHVVSQCLLLNFNSWSLYWGLYWFNFSSLWF